MSTHNSLAAKSVGSWALAWIGGVMLSVAITAGAVRAEVGVLVLSDGSREMGNITQTPMGYVVSLGGQKKVFEGARVKDVLNANRLRKDLDSQKAKADLKRPESLLALAMWCLDNGLADEAEGFAQDILKIEPEHANAKRVLGFVADLRRKLSGLPGEGAAVPSGQQETGTTPVPPVGPPPTSQAAIAMVRQPLPLSKEDISKIRIREIWIKDNKPDDVKVAFKNDVLNRFYKEMEGLDGFKTPEDRAYFMKQSMSRKLQIIVQASDTKSLKKWEKDIDVESDPPPLMTFRNKVYPFIVENCATATCHGKDNAPGFSWINTATPSPGQYLANFLELEARTYGTQQLMLVNRDKPEESLVLMYSLPAGQSPFKHPKVDGYPVRAINEKSPGYVETLKWITKDLSYPPRPDYGVTLRHQGDPPVPVEKTP